MKAAGFSLYDGAPIMHDARLDTVIYLHFVTARAANKTGGPSVYKKFI